MINCRILPLLLIASRAAAELSVTLPPDGSTMDIQKSGNQITLGISNPGNHTWTLQTTSDFKS